MYYSRENALSTGVYLFYGMDLWKLDTTEPSLPSFQFYLFMFAVVFDVMQ